MITFKNLANSFQHYNNCIYYFFFAIDSLKIGKNILEILTKKTN